MTHVRQQIRENAASELDAAIPEFKEVATTRLYAYREESLPSLNVVTLPEESEVMTMGTQLVDGMQKRVMQRTLTLMTEIYVSVLSDDDKIDDEMDRLSVEVEKVMESTLLSGAASDISLAQTEYTVDAEGEVPVGVIILAWQVIYRTYEGDPETSVGG